LAKLRKEGLEAGKRVSLSDKKNKTDFVLWKFSKNPGVRQQEWKSPWGVGFPGWHIECSAMSAKYLGEQFDIHTGGEDHIPVHHTNEIAQSECAFGERPCVRYWLHGAFLKFRGEKMSKSKGKIATISELEKQGYPALIYRYFVLTAHYRKQLNFSLENLRNAKTSYNRLKNVIAELKDDGMINSKYIGEFEQAINNDLDMPNALQVLWALVRDSKALGKVGAVREMDKVFGLDLLKKEKVSVPVDVRKLVKEREKFRLEKNWAKADKIREKIKGMGWKVEDGVDGVRVSKL